MHAIENHVTMSDGVRLFTRTVDQSAAADPGRPTLLIPNGIIYLEELAPLCRTHRLIGYDLRNRGASDPDPAARGLPGDVEDLEHLRAALGLARCATFGHSYVGLMVAVHAMRHPGPIERVVMVGAPPPDAAATYPPELAYSDGVLPAAFAEIRRLQQEGADQDPVAFSTTVWDALRSIYVADPANAPKIRWNRPELANERKFLGYWTETVEPSLRALRLTEADFAALTAAVLVVHGRKDRIAPFGGALDWAARLPAARLLDVAEAAHAPWLEDASVIPAIAAFLGEGVPA